VQQTQNVSIGHGFVNNGTMVVHPIELFQQEAVPSPGGTDTPLLAAGVIPHGEGPPPGSGIVRALNFIGWTLFAFSCAGIAVATFAVIR